MSNFQDELKTLLPGLMASPRLYLHTLDMEKGQGLIIEANGDFYKKAVFLDQRVLSETTPGAWVPLKVLWPLIDAGMGKGVAPANFIFHVGHAGSTLVSRLLDELPPVLGLREPLALRVMAAGFAQKEALPEGAFDSTFKRIYPLLVRRFSPEQQVIIKATSMCNNLAPLLLSQNSANRGLGLFVSLEVFLANMLDKEETPDIEGFLGFRIAALKKNNPGLELEELGLSQAEKIALSWLSEAFELSKLATSEFAWRTLLMDFDLFLEKMELHLSLIFKHFGLPGGEKALAKVLVSPVLKSYAKQPGFAFTPKNREAILSESKKANQAEIGVGLALVERLMKSHPELAKISEKIPLA